MRKVKIEFVIKNKFNWSKLVPNKTGYPKKIIFYFVLQNLKNILQDSVANF